MSSSTEQTPAPELNSAETSKAPAKKTEVVSLDGTAPSRPAGDAPRTEMPVSAVARLLGVATATDLSLIEGKVDLMVNKVNALQARMEKVLTALQGMPSGTDLERIDVQIGALRTMVRDAMAAVVGEATANKKSE